MTNKAIHNRLRRVAGQLDTLTTTITTDAVCADVIPQFLAVKGALNAAFEAYLKESLEECGSSDKETMKQLITTLIRK